MSLHIKDIYKPLRGSTVEVSLDFLKMTLDRGYILDPDFQRDHVWTDEQASEFVGFILEGGQTGQPIVVNTRRYENEGIKIVVDGKQRLTSLVRWLNGEIPATLSDGRQINRNNIEGRLSRVSLSFLRVDMTRDEMLAYYIKTNSGGTVHSEEEIERVRRLLLQSEKDEENE